jgi:hypothetical protein
MNNPPTAHDPAPDPAMKPLPKKACLPPIARRLLPLAGLLLALRCAAQSEAPPPPLQLDTVTTELKRDSAILPYERLNRLLNGFRQHGQGLVRMDFKIIPADPQRPIPKLKMAVMHDEGFIPIAIDADGRFELPVLPPAQAKGADLATNIPKGSIHLEGKLYLTTPPDQLDMATVRRIVSTARTLRSELLPWYARWVFPQIDGVRVCSAEPRWSLEWPERGQTLELPLSADPKDRDPDAPKDAPSKPCATLTGQERWPDTARLVAPADAKLSVRLRN